jgi:LmbE family N-acetylglucosaminyl deacetylase
MQISLHNAGATWEIPDRADPMHALARTTHLGIGAHQDDLEFMAFHGISACYGREDRWFTGVTCTDGAGSPRAGRFATKTAQELCRIRREEQNRAAHLGKYSAILQLDYSSTGLKEPGHPAARRLEEDLFEILRAAQPEVVYTHNPADKHGTHLAVLWPALRALRRLPGGEQPHVYGCEVWRDLDWLPEEHKVRLEVSEHGDLAAQLNAVFESQLTGKRYDLAVLGRRRAHATFDDSHATDQSQAVTLAMDLTPLLHQPDLHPGLYLKQILQKFQRELLESFSALE